MNKSSLIRRIGDGVLDLVYPPGLYCICCGKIVDDSRTYRMCNDCIKAMNWVSDRRCLRCGKPLAAADPGDRCFACSERARNGHDHAFDRGYACAGYGSCEQALIFALKYGGRSDIADTIGEIMYDRMTAVYETDELAGMYDIVTPVPIYREKRGRRGFNQAELIGRYFAGEAGISYEPDLLIRTRETLPMKGLDPGERQCNIAGAFEIRTRKLLQVNGARILLIEINRRVLIQSNDLRKPLISQGFRHMRLCIGEARAGIVA